MNNDFEYYLIEPVITERTPLLMCDGRVDSKGINFLYKGERVADDYLAHLRFAMPQRNPDMNVDYLFLDTHPVFSKKVCDALNQHMPIKNLQLVEAEISEYGKTYKDFWIAFVYRRILSFNVNLSTYDEIDEDGYWFGVDKIVLDKNLLSEIPLEDRLIFMAKEDPAFTLFHESIVEIIKLVNPKGMRFIPVEAWTDAMVY